MLFPTNNISMHLAVPSVRFGSKAAGRIGRRNQQVVSNFIVAILRFAELRLAELRLAFVSNFIVRP